MKVDFLGLLPIDEVTGGNVYNKHVLNQLNSRGFNCTYYCLPDLCDDSIEPEIEILIVDSLLLFKHLNSFIRISKEKKLIGLIHSLPFTIGEARIAIKELLFSNIHPVFTSHLIKEQIQNMYPGIKKISVIEPGVEVNSEKRTFNNPTRNIITVSNLVPEKGIIALVDFLFEVKDLDWKLCIYGNTKIDKAHALQVNKKIAHLGLNEKIQIHEPVSQEELHQIMADKDLLIHNSPFETFGMILKEAIAIGLPFLSTKVGCLNEMEKVEGGFVFPVGDKEMFLKLFRNIYCSDLKELGIEPKTIEPQKYQTWYGVGNQFVNLVRVL